MKIATHGNRYHCDDVVAVSLLKILYSSTTVERVNKSTPLDDFDFVVDIGGVHAPMMGRFDHHQGDIEPRANGVPYASAGLVWDAFNAKVVTRVIADAVEKNPRRLPADILGCEGYSDRTLSKVMPHIKKRVDEYLFQGIDAWDNGIFPEDKSGSLSSFVWDAGTADVPFDTVVDTVSVIVRSAVISQTVEAIRYLHAMNLYGFEFMSSGVVLSNHVHVKSISWFRKTQKITHKSQQRVSAIISPSAKTNGAFSLLLASGRKHHFKNKQDAISASLKDYPCRTDADPEEEDGPDGDPS